MHRSATLPPLPPKQDFSLLPLVFGDTRHAGTAAIEPAAVLPEQFFHTPTVGLSSRGEFALMWAVFEDALLCSENRLTRSRGALQLACEAEEWIYSNDEHWPFSFLNICLALGLDPDAIRLQLAHRRQAAARPLQRKRRRVVSAQAPLSLAA